jgi:hypothetical protein
MIWRPTKPCLGAPLLGGLIEALQGICGGPGRGGDRLMPAMPGCRNWKTSRRAPPRRNPPSSRASKSPVVVELPSMLCP